MPKYIVKHPKLMLKVGTKLQKISAGSEIELSEKAAEGLLSKGKIISAADAPAVKVTEAEEVKAKDETPKPKAKG